MIRVGDVARIIEQHFPLHFAQAGDNCGLQAGHSRQVVRSGVLVALDPSKEAVRRAVGHGVGLLVTHHPLFYDPLRGIDTSTSVGAAAAEAISAAVAVYSAHTNLDGAPGGLAWELARRAGLAEIGYLNSITSEGRYKLVVFVPRHHLEKVHRAMADAGAGVIGRYDSCAFVIPGEGRYRPLKGAHPVVGKPGKLEKVNECRLEMLVREGKSAAVIEAMKAAHPYEEVAYDLCTLSHPGEGGYGCVGNIGPLPFSEYLGRLAAVFKTTPRASGRPPSRIGRVAVVPGSGGGYLEESFRTGAGLLVTGEVRYHQMVEAEHLGMGIVELGHDRSELAAIDLLAGALRRGLATFTQKCKVFTYRRAAAVKIPPDRKRQAKRK